MVSAEGESSKNKRTHVKLLSMILGIAAMLVVCHSLEPLTQPPVTIAIMDDECAIYSETYRALVMFVTCLETLSYASNFLFYFMCNNIIRKSLIDMVKCRV